MNAGKQIIFADNDPAGLSAHEERLQRDGCTVQTVTDGVAALKLISAGTPDLVILDLRLPKLNGGEVFKFMRLEPRLKNVPVILFTHGTTIDWPKNVPQGPIRCVPERASTFPLLPELIQEMLDPSASTGEFAADNRSASDTPHTASPAYAIELPTHEIVEETADNRTGFLSKALQDMPKLHEHYMLYLRSPTSPSGQRNLTALRERIDNLRDGAAKTGCPQIELLAKAMSELLMDLQQKPGRTTPSLSQTLAQAFDSLRSLLSTEEDIHSRPVSVPKVLCVDDDEICNQVALAALERINAEAHSADSASGALELLRTKAYDLALLDINMPGLSGFQLCEALRGIPHCKNMPIIFVTAFNNFDNRKQSVLNGAEDFITKPVYAFELALKVTICLFKKRPIVDVDDARKEIEMLAAVVGEPAALATKFINQSDKKEETTTFTKAGLAMNAIPTITATSPSPEIEPQKESKPPIAQPAVALAIATPPEKTAEKTSSRQAVGPAPAMTAPPASAPITTKKPADVPAAPLKQASTESITAKPIGSNENRPMKPEKNGRFEMLVSEVSTLIFGSAATDLNQRLVRMALEQACQNGLSPQSFETVAAQVARLIFGDAQTSELNVRLVRMALERVYSDQQVVKA